MRIGAKPFYFVFIFFPSIIFSQYLYVVLNDFYAVWIANNLNYACHNTICTKNNKFFP